MRKNKIEKEGARKEDLRLPRHIGIIMDGNGRWAKKRLMPRGYGHKKGVDRMIGLLKHAFDLGVDYVTVYALSTENLNRPKEELEGLYNLIRERFADVIQDVCARGARMKIVGEVALLPEDVREIVQKAEKDTARFSGKGINVALCYGGRAEIVRAAKELVERGEPITEEGIAKHLYTADQPEPDFIIRTGKEKRLSNFLLYQSAYAELYFSDKMFPEFSDRDLEEAIEEFSRRTRRFGKTDEQCEETL